MRYVEFMDIEVPGAGALGQIEFDPFLAAVASLRDNTGQHLVKTWIDPAPAMSIVDAGTLRLRDAASSVVINTVSGMGVLEKTTSLNSQPTFEAGASCALKPDVANRADSGVPANEFSMLAVHNLTPAANARYDLFGIGDGPLGAGILYPGIEIYSNSTANDSFITLREGGSTTRRIIASAPGILGQTAISMITFSVENGLSAWWNKNMIKAEPGETASLDETTWAYLGNRSGANPALGKFGMAMILRVDLSKSEHALARNIILDGLMNKYGIA